jgi:hypothetical protein
MSVEGFISYLEINRQGNHYIYAYSCAMSVNRPAQTVHPSEGNAASYAH